MKQEELEKLEANPGEAIVATAVYIGEDSGDIYCAEFSDLGNARIWAENTEHKTILTILGADGLTVEDYT